MTGCGAGYRSVVLGLAVSICVGCLAEDPASFRTLTLLAVGQWTLSTSGDLPSWFSLQPDDTFTSNNGVTGVFVRDLHGAFWWQGDVIGFRGLGELRTGVRVKFVQATLTDTPRLTLTLTEIADDYVEDFLEIEDLNTMTGEAVQRAVRLLSRFAIPEEELGVVEVYFK